MDGAAPLASAEDHALCGARSAGARPSLHSRIGHDSIGFHIDCRHCRVHLEGKTHALLSTTAREKCTGKRSGPLAHASHVGLAARNYLPAPCCTGSALIPVFCRRNLSRFAADDDLARTLSDRYPGIPLLSPVLCLDLQQLEGSPLFHGHQQG